MSANGLRRRQESALVRRQNELAKWKERFPKAASDESSSIINIKIQKCEQEIATLKQRIAI
jgi:hypothetical protein